MIMPNYQFGDGTPVVSLRIHQKARLRLLEKMPKGGVVLLRGGEAQTRYETDTDAMFHQESYFHYLFGAEEGSCYGAVELDTGRSVLFIPRLPESYAVWMGSIHGLEHYCEKYAVDQVSYVDQLSEYMKKYEGQTVYLLSGINSDSQHKSIPASFDRIDRNFIINTELLHPILSESRAIKFDEELNVLRAVCKISSEAHKAVMRMVKPGISEFHIESTFLYEAYFRGGCRFSAYTCVCGSGDAGSILHNFRNRGPVRDGDMILVDMGAEYYGYASDITCSYPANGKFTERQRPIYNAVLRANRAVLAQLKAGVSWPDMHRLSEHVLLEGLLDTGLVRGNVDEMMKYFIAPLFYPHGLGHLLGLDVHDCGGYIPGAGRSPEPGLRSLRCGRQLEARMVITVEPGCYFIEPLIVPAFSDPIQSKFLNEARIREYFGFGGVRIEDNVIITEDGYELLSDVPRTPEEIESLMQEPYVSPVDSL